MQTDMGSPAVEDHVIKDMLWAFAVRSPEHAILLIDSDGDITWTNAGAELILGASDGGLVGQNMERFFTRRDATAGIPQHERVEARHRGTASDDRWLVRMDGSRFWASGVTVYLGDLECCSFLKAFRDLTEFKMQLEANRERFFAARETSEGKSAAIALLAHELRNPLSGISLAASLMQHRIDGESRLDEPIGVIQRNVELATRLISDLMEHSKVNAARFQLVRKRVDLRELIDSSLCIARHQMEQDDREVRVLLPSRKIEVEVDRMRMQQVFVNLLTNAIRYTPMPGRIWLSATLEGPEVIVRVVDEGIGIEPARLERLFEMFTLPRVEGSRLGLGLGLSLVKKIVELHGGSVQARSEGPGKGSQFVVRFPTSVNGTRTNVTRTNGASGK